VRCRDRRQVLRECRALQIQQSQFMKVLCSSRPCPSQAATAGPTQSHGSLSCLREIGFGVWGLARMLQGSGRCRERFESAGPCNRGLGAGCWE